MALSDGRQASDISQIQFANSEQIACDNCQQDENHKDGGFDTDENWFFLFSFCEDEEHCARGVKQRAEK